MKAISGEHDVQRLRDNKRFPSQKGKNDRNVATKSHGKSYKKCSFCGNEHPLKRDKYLAREQNGSGCGGRNHFKSVCKKTKRKGIHGISEHNDESSSEEREIEFLGGATTDSQETDIHAAKYAKEIYAEMLIGDKKVNFQIDCGASINIIPAKHASCHEIAATSKTL